MENRDMQVSQEKEGFQNVHATLRKILDGFGGLIGDADFDKYIDLHESGVEKVKMLLDELQASGKFVFHGNPTKEIIYELQPRQAIDNETSENSMNAVFASPRYLEALAYGVLDKFNLSRVWRGFTVNVGHQEPEGVSIKLEPEVYQTLQSNPAEYLQDVLLYVLDKADFSHVPNREENEYYSTDAVSPLLTLYIPRDIAINSIQILPFSEEDVQNITPAERR